jgi:Uma2 family endonuclease
MTTQLEVTENLATVEAGKEPEEMASGLHGFIGVRLGRYLDTFAEANNLGWTFSSSTTFNIANLPPKREPDVSFVRIERMATPPDEEITVAPDLAVEIVSKNDTAYEIEKKVNQYQQWGVGLVWIIYPVSRTVAVYRVADGLKPQVLKDEDELEGFEILPSFKLKVNALFVKAK